tara:strand:+ start:11795 stop:11929 length:135 start_codon:yes stop_codon:yes gene_type:complete
MRVGGRASAGARSTPREAIEVNLDAGREPGEVVIRKLIANIREL